MRHYVAGVNNGGQPPLSAPGPAAGHPAAVGRHHRRTARRRTVPQYQRPQRLHPVDRDGVPLSPAPRRPR